MYQHQNLHGRLEPAPKVRPLRTVTRPHARSDRNQKQRKETRPARIGRNGFLTTSFPPLLAGMPEELKNSKQVGRDFFASAERLCSLYEIACDSQQGTGYPLNILRAFGQLQIALKATSLETGLCILSDEGEGRSAFLATIKTFDTRTTLYYLPVEPLYKLLTQGKRKKTAELLLSVVAYFYQVGGVPYHTENDCYLYYMYNMVSEFLLESEAEQGETEALETYAAEIQQMEIAGIWLLEKIADRKNLDLLAQRTKAYRPKTKAEEQLSKIAQRVCNLLENYPSRSIVDSIYGGMFTEGSEEECASTAVSADQYISFIWSRRDSLYDQLMDAVNAELNELDSIDEPVSIQFFDAPQASINHNLFFEAEFFDLLNELSDNLDDLMP